jgi:hypothetical protein
VEVHLRLLLEQVQ